MKKFLLIFVFIIPLLSTNKGFGQLSVSYQFSSWNKIGLGYNFSPTSVQTIGKLQTVLDAIFQSSAGIRYTFGKE